MLPPRHEDHEAWLGWKEGRHLLLELRHFARLKWLVTQSHSEDRTTSKWWRDAK